MLFDKIGAIDPHHPDTWQDKIFITVDIDWACDTVIDLTLDLLVEHNKKATIFTTHESESINRIKELSNFEIGIHPNFNPLLQGKFDYGNTYEKVLDKFRSIHRHSTAIRSHSMVQSSVLLNTFSNMGFTHDCNTFVPFSSGVELAPWTHWNSSLIKVPYFWEDDIHCISGWEWDLDKLVRHPGLKVFDFHPIHVYLNTHDIELYESTRSLHNTPSMLAGKVNRTEYGTRDLFLDLLSI